MGFDWKAFLLGLILGLWIATAWCLSQDQDGNGGGGCPPAPDDGKPVVDDDGYPVVDDDGCQIYKVE